MKEKTLQFMLSDGVKEAIVSAQRGCYTAQARAVLEGSAVGASYRQVAKVIRACVDASGKGWTACTQALLDGMNAAKVTEVNGEKLEGDKWVDFVASAMSAGAKRHSDDMAKSRADAKAKKQQDAAAAAAAAVAAAAVAKKSDLLRAKVAELESWIIDAQGKLEAARGELEKALVEEANETTRNVASLKAFYGSIGAPVPENLVELMETAEIRSDLELAKKHEKALAEIRQARLNAEKAKEAQAQAENATPAPIPEVNEVDNMLKERAESIEAAITAQRVARHARKTEKVA